MNNLSTNWSRFYFVYLLRSPHQFESWEPQSFKWFHTCIQLFCIKQVLSSFYKDQKA